MGDGNMHYASGTQCCSCDRKQPDSGSRWHLRLLSRLQFLHKLAEDFRRLSSSSDGLLCLLAHCIVIAAAPRQHSIKIHADQELAGHCYSSSERGTGLFS